jgi:hypothetical protein
VLQLDVGVLVLLPPLVVPCLPLFLRDLLHPRMSIAPRDQRICARRPATTGDITPLPPPICSPGKSRRRRLQVRGEEGFHRKRERSREGGEIRSRERERGDERRTRKRDERAGRFRRISRSQILEEYS